MRGLNRASRLIRSRQLEPGNPRAGLIDCQATYSWPPVTVTAGLLSTRPKTLPGVPADAREGDIVAAAFAAAALVLSAPQPARSRQTAASGASRMAVRASRPACAAFMAVETPEGGPRLRLV
jgi:hypothetical protein